ncbi:MAG: hypothetical protein AAFP15_17905 [Bacteroidota bacterium]
MVDPLDRFKSGKHACKPFRYKRNQRKPKEKPDKTVILGLECAHKRTPNPHPRVFEITGRYESAEGTPFSVCLNQAGNFIALWMSKTADRTAHHYVGSGEQPNFLLYDPDDLDTAVGWLTVGVTPHEITVQLDSGPFKSPSPREFYQFSTRATLSDRAIARLGTTEEAQYIARVEHSPLRHKTLVALTKLLTGSTLTTALAEFFDADDDDHGLAGELRKAGSNVNEVFHNALTRDKDIAHVASRLQDYRRHIHRTLRTRTWTWGGANKFGPNSGASSTRPLYEWLMAVIERRRRPPFQEDPPYNYPISYLQQDFLGLPDRPADMPYEYEFALQQTGIAGDVGVGINAFKGDLKIRQTKPVEQDAPWEYITMVVGFSLGFSAGVSVIKEATGIGRSHVPWQEPDFLGRVEAFESGSAAAPYVGKAKGVTAWRIHSAGGPGVMDVSFGDALVVGATAGIESGEASGYIRQDDDALKEVIVKAHTAVWDGYDARYRGKQAAHFDLGSARLTAHATNALGYMAAAELAALQRPSSKMLIIGNADRVDRAWYNELLSRVRAENVAQVFEDCLGDELKATVDTVGLGEASAEHAGDRDQTENPKYRRVTLYLDGHSIAKLQVARP